MRNSRINLDKDGKEIYSIYLHIFPNNKVYVGITKYIPKYRWGKDGNGYDGQIVWKAIQKYNWNSITHKILLETTDKDLAEKTERYYITEVYHSNNIKNGYNIENGGKYAGRISEDMKQHLRKLNLGKTQSEETIQKKIAATKGRKASLETRKKQSIAAKGRVFTEEHRKNLSKAHIGKVSPKKGTGMSKEEKRLRHHEYYKKYYSNPENRRKIAEHLKLKRQDPIYKAALNKKRREKRLLLKNLKTLNK